MERDFQAGEIGRSELREPDAETPAGPEPEEPLMLTDAMCGMACEVKRRDRLA